MTMMHLSQLLHHPEESNCESKDLWDINNGHCVGVFFSSVVARHSGLGIWRCGKKHLHLVLRDTT